MNSSSNAELWCDNGGTVGVVLELTGRYRIGSAFIKQWTLRMSWRRCVVQVYRLVLELWRSSEANCFHRFDVHGLMAELMERVKTSFEKKK